MKTARVLLAAASLIVTPHLFAQDGSDAGHGDRARPGPARQARPGNVLRLRGVADGEMLKLFSLDMRFRGEDVAGSQGPRGAGLVRIGEDRFRARVVEVEFRDDEEPTEDDEDDDATVSSDEEEAVDGGGRDGDRSRRRRRRRRHVARLVVELHATDGEPVPEPMPMEAEDGEDGEFADDEVEPGIAPVDPPPESTPIGKLVLERGVRPLGDREVPVAQGEASVEDRNYAILARVPHTGKIARRVRRQIRRRRRDRPARDDSTEPNTGAADSVDSGF